jgi:hypothetical protein
MQQRQQDKDPRNTQTAMHNIFQDMLPEEADDHKCHDYHQDYSQIGRAHV